MSSFWQIQRQVPTSVTTIHRCRPALLQCGWFQGNQMTMDLLGSSVQFSHSVVSDSLRLHEPQHPRPPTPSPTPRGLPKLTSVEWVMPPNHLIICRPLLFLPSIFPSIRVFSNESVLGIKWPKYWSFSFSISPSNEYSGLISFRTDQRHLFSHPINPLLFALYIFLWYILSLDILLYICLFSVSHC